MGMRVRFNDGHARFFCYGKSGGKMDTAVRRMIYGKCNI